MGNRRHADIIVTCQLWEQVCQQLIEKWEDLDVRAQNQERERIVKRWRSIRDHVNKEFNRDAGPEWFWRTQEQIQVCRSPVVPQDNNGDSKHRRESEAELNPSGAIPQEAATEGQFDSPGPSAPSHSAPCHSAPCHSAPSQPFHTSDPSVRSASAGASWPVPLHVSAGEDIAFPVPHPSAAATFSTPVASGRHRQRGQVQSYVPEFLHLNASFQNCLKVLSEQMAAGFNLINKSILELHTLLLSMRSEASQSPNNTFFQSVLEQMEMLSASQQMQVMEAFQPTLALIASKAETLATHAAHALLPLLSITTATTILLTRSTNLPMPYPTNLTITHIVPVPRPTSHNTASVTVPHPTSQTTSVPSVPLPTILTNMMIPTHTTSHLLHPCLLSLPATNSLFHLLPNPLLHPSLLLPPNPPKTSPTPPPSYQIPNLNPTFLSSRSIAFSTPSPLSIDPSPPPAHSSLHTPTVEVSLTAPPALTPSRLIPTFIWTFTSRQLRDPKNQRLCTRQQSRHLGSLTRDTDLTCYRMLARLKEYRSAPLTITKPWILLR
ncbi:uncharacterized protein [Ranitomeya imitator]|uniref:uncharacterized protein n=1 Tax=Ranitomeya imitator TaxID=111125 RepID=UPI0037E7CC09